MRAGILWPWEIEDLTGKTAVVVDLWAATSNIALMLGKGAGRITVVNNENVVQAKKENPGALVVGEHFQLPADFFDYSNYPVNVNKIHLTSTVLYMTTNGAYVIEQAFTKGAGTVITGSVLNFDAISRYLKREDPEGVVIIPSGERKRGEYKAEEDLLCAEMFLKVLTNEKVDMDEYIEKFKKIILKEYGYEPFDEDANFEIIFQPNKYNVVPICTKSEWVIIRDLNT